MAITEEPPLELLEIQDWFRNVVRKTSWSCSEAQGNGVRCETYVCLLPDYSQCEFMLIETCHLRFP
jgi:hypothetical protein